MKLNASKFLALLVLSLATFIAVPARAADPKPEGKRDLDTILTDQRIKRMNTELTLSDEQKEKVRPLVGEEIKFFRSLRENESLTEDARIQKEKEFRDASKPKYKAILSEEQFGKWEKMFEKKPRKPKAQ